MPRPTFPLAALALIPAALALAAPADPAVLDAMDELRFTPPKEKGKAELVPGRDGRAVRFAFEKDARGAFFTSRIRGTPAWDRAAGFSFWVKGDGADQFGGVELIYDDDYAVRYDLCFPVTGGEWTKVTAAWGDLVPVLPGPRAKPLGPGGNPPSKVSALWVGKWWYWGDYPAGAFAVDDLRLEAKIERPADPPKPAGPPLARVRAKLKAGKPVTVVTLGDSLTDTRHWANRKTAWPALVAERAKAAFGSGVTVVNPAIGGTQLRQNLVLTPRWAATTPAPDLVTVFFGGNDWDAGMRGPEFAAACSDAAARIRRATGGAADVLFLTTAPGADRWTTTDELAAAARTAAKETNAGVADVQKAFHDAGKENRGRLFVDDKVHLSPAGHALVADTVLKAITGAG